MASWDAPDLTNIERHREALADYRGTSMFKDDDFPGPGNRSNPEDSLSEGGEGSEGSDPGTPGVRLRGTAVPSPPLSESEYDAEEYDTTTARWYDEMNRSIEPQMEEWRPYR